MIKQVLFGALSALFFTAAFAGESDLAIVDDVFLAPPAPQTMFFPVTRIGDAAYEVILKYHTADGTALSSSDYVATSGTASIAANSAGTFLPVTIKPGSASAPSKTFQMQLDGALGIGPQPEFAAAQAFTVGTSPYSVAAADLNGDGRIDLVVGNLDDNTVSVLINTSVPGVPPQFTAQQIFAAGPGPFATVADVNGDSRPDILVADSGGSTVSILLNTTPPGATTATFAARQTFAAGHTRAIAAFDVNGDGRKDIVVGNGVDSTVSVLINSTPAGAAIATFAPQQVFPVAGTAIAVKAADFNGDGKQDLLVSTYSALSVSVLLNTTALGAPVASFAPEQTFVHGAQSGEIAIADLNADGRPDFAVLNDSGAIGGAASVMINLTPTGALAASFSSAQNFPSGVAADSIVNVDVNGDGKPDLLIGGNDPSAKTLSVLINATPPGASTAEFIAPRAFATGPLPVALVVADMDNDGKPDVVATNLGSQTVSLLINTAPLAEATLDFAPAQFVDAGTTMQAVVSSDFNGDGKPDIASANLGSGSVSVRLNATMPGDTRAQFGAPTTIATGPLPNFLSAVDFDGDGRPDIAAAAHNNGVVSILLNATPPGSSMAQFAPEQAFQAGLFVTEMEVADLNGDGRPDLVVSDNSSYSLSVMFNTTPASATQLSFTPPQQIEPMVDARAVKIADLNGDGKPDIAAADLNAGTVSVLFNSTPPGSAAASFTAAQTFNVGGEPLSLAIADMDANGTPDIIVGDYGSAAISLLRNFTVPGSTTGVFLHNLTPVGFNVTSIAVADMAGSGRPDVIAIGSEGNGAVLLGARSLTQQVPFSAGNDGVWVTTGDFNLDGRPDLVTVTNQIGQLALLLNTQFRATIVIPAATGTIIRDSIFSAGFE